MLYALKTTFILVKNIASKVILRSPFLSLLYSFHTSSEGITTCLRTRSKIQIFYLPFKGKITLLKQYSISKHINTIKRENSKEKQINTRIAISINQNN